MKIKGLLAFTALLATATFTNAQQTYVDLDSGGVDFIYTKKAPSEAAQGTQYYIENFNAAKINDSKEIVLARYNAYSDEMEVKVHDEIMVLDPKEDMVVALTNKSATYVFTQYKNEDGEMGQNYLVLVSDNPNLKIFRSERIFLQPEKHPDTGYQKYKAPMYKKRDAKYYIQMNNGEIVHMSDRRKDIMALIPGKEKDIKTFMKKNKIKVSEDNDLKLLGNYLNTLL
ncbi:hypothetical protein [Flavobacterium litorale]|uniref:Uncharacterized protein n=1 Tax=Flavobacterium litorale TaxID=2856519 RepID=A0ABX8VB96_9FLAO|nr:hypothetical protein [Flavobacterium litorale]QYJ69398.1 hypothetical protein K1I41_05785 [Flavobacterium litorale]